MRKKHSFHISCFILVFLLISMNIQVFASTPVSLNKTSDTLAVGGTDTLVATVTPINGTTASVNWVSSDPSIVNVFNGVIMAVGPGTAVVTAVTSNGTAACVVTVSNPVTTITLNKTSDVLASGQTDTLTATVNQVSASQTTAVNQTVNWTTSNPSVAVVANGVVMAVQPGNATITATTAGGSNVASCYITVNTANTLMQIALNKKADILMVGGTDTLTASVIATADTNTTVNWTSSDSNIVKVVGGVIFGVNPGSAVITATTADGSQSATCNVSVTSPGSVATPVQSINLNKTSDALTVGGTDTLTAAVLPTTASQVVTWTSSNPSVAGVSNGVVAAVGAGNAVITATTGDGSQSATCSVFVSAATSVQTVNLNKASDALTIGGTDTLTAAVLPATASQVVTWTSSNPSVAAVANGVITAVSAGTATITATSADGSQSATCTITVNNAASSTTPSNAMNTIRLGGADRYGTAVAISQAGWKGTSDYAVLASGNDFPDGLSSAALAKKYNAPILLTDKNSIPQSVLNEIKRLQVKHIFITGGTGVVSQAVQNQLTAMNITIDRFGGKDRFETSVKIAEKLGVASGGLMVASGYQWSDALTASSIAAQNGIPIILTDKDTLPDSVNTFLNENDFSKTYILGDTDLISNTVANQFPNPQRIVGSTVYERNINIIKAFENNMNFSNICIASGRNFPDSISGSAFAAMISSPIVLVDDSNLQAITTQYTNGKLTQVNNVYIFGLQGAVNDNVIPKLFNK